MALTFQEIDEFFKKYGWETEKKSDMNWYVYVKGKFTNYNLYADLTEHFLYMYLAPYVRIPADEKCKVNLYEHMLRLNRDISITKFVISGEIIELLGVFSTDSVQYEEFVSMIDLLLYNADNNYLEIMNIAGNPDVVSSYLTGEKNDGKEGGEGEKGDDDGDGGDGLDWTS